MRKFFVFVSMMLLYGNVFAISSSGLVSCTTGTVSTACAAYATTYCGGGATTCGTVVLDGISYSNKCRCLACGGTGLTIPSSTAPHCVCSDSACTKNSRINSSTHLSTVSYSSTSTASCFSSVTATSPTTLKSFCAAKVTAYECASGYGSISKPTSSTQCYACDTAAHSTDSGATFSSGNSPCTAANAIYTSGSKKYYKAWNANSWTGATRAPTALPSTANCGTCASDCWYVSPVTLQSGSNCYGVILYGCPLKYATTSCNGTGCGNATKSSSTGKCVCKSGYYGTAANSCNACPVDSVTGKQTSSAGATQKSQCYVPSAQTVSDGTGTYSFVSPCYYSE